MELIFFIVGGFIQLMNDNNLYWLRLYAVLY